MFDIEKARLKGIDSRTIEILQSINENTLKRESCALHEFEPITDKPLNIVVKIVGVLKMEVSYWHMNRD